MTFKNIVIIGSSGAIGSALTEHVKALYPDAALHTFSSSDGSIHYQNESSIEAAAKLASTQGPIDMVIVATGMLHDNEIMPEKSLKELSAEKLKKLFEVNTITPALIAKHFLPYLNRESTSYFAALSARVGSISDNQLGGWYSYRASKAALNMIIKNASIEVARRNKKAVIVGLHPGTVDSYLSKPFQGSVPEGKLFTPEYSAERLVNVLKTLTVEDNGKCFDWNGLEILP